MPLSINIAFLVSCRIRIWTQMYFPLDIQTYHTCFGIAEPAPSVAKGSQWDCHACLWQARNDRWETSLFAMTDGRLRNDGKMLGQNIELCSNWLQLRPPLIRISLFVARISCPSPPTRSQNPFQQLKSKILLFTIISIICCYFAQIIVPFWFQYFTILVKYYFTRSSHMLYFFDTQSSCDIISFK